MLKTTLLAAAALLTVSGAAQAATIDILLGSTDTYETGGAFNPNIDLSSNTSPIANTGMVLSIGGTGNLSIPGLANEPTGSLYGNKYLAILANSSATFSLVPNTASFSLTWGSIDSYNSLILTTTNGTYTITGTDILHYIGGGTNKQANVVVSDPLGKIVTAELTSTSNSFEAANFGSSSKVQSVPLPASSILFAMALAGLGLVAYRNRRAI